MRRLIRFSHHLSREAQDENAIATMLSMPLLLLDSIVDVQGKVVSVATIPNPTVSSDAIVYCIKFKPVKPPDHVNAICMCHRTCQ